MEVEVEVAEWRLEFELLSRKLWLPRRRHFRSIPLSLGEFPQKVFLRQYMSLELDLSTDLLRFDCPHKLSFRHRL